ncbi:hypothetical protein CC1G_08832 [Coprinopsis cinerea okayama7|uniref:ubiquitinyl hydrolase 1 n=1 Tax=Coprinopsis cinerea (strain Okayama-7 / 130 / ATCC MYA-4618 / FGSC 9003) TaxID=240176 RepID=A8P692_COPC7|nr:hypothetical protein CC1G_08832 [Coprinopsis cinerea okayama7\|eukprot:XP_001839106.1 hypothetical protein CC1G_08832 [Coprinopsis cinerea okayama7\
MGIESYLPWMWSSSSAASGSTGSTGKSGSREKKKDRKAIRTRAEQIQLNGNAKQHGSGKEEEDEGYYPGLVNVSGTYCFMNSTLQALASLSYLQPHIDAIHAKAEALDVPTPVIDALKELFQDLNTPKSAYRAIRPMDIINVLSQQTEGRTNSLFYSREHQDAQELFQVVSECIKNELAAVDKEGLRDRGFGSALDKPSETTKEIGKSVFDGLTANRRSCVVCGYTEAVMHFAFDNWQLSVPRMAGSCRLEDCLEDYTRLEILKDCICRKCSLVATHNRLKQELATLEEATKPGTNPSSSKKRRLKEVRKFEARVRAALAEGRIEEDLKDVRIEKVFSPASTKQAMIARPPPVLALHLNRSIHYGHYAGKNNCRVAFPEVLDLTPFTTSGSLSTIPTASISTPPPAVPRSTTPTPSTYSNQRTIYRLAAVVCHFGGHSFGHYICYRRKPRPTGLPKEKRFAPPVLVDPLRIPDGDVDDENQAQSQGPEYIFEDGETQPGKGWLRISDDSVRECGIESVLAEGAGVFMLYYERAVPPRPGIYPSQSGTRVSEETLRPEMKTVELNGSVGSFGGFFAIVFVGEGQGEGDTGRERFKHWPCVVTVDIVGGTKGDQKCGGWEGEEYEYTTVVLRGLATSIELSTIRIDAEIASEWKCNPLGRVK